MKPRSKKSKKFQRRNTQKKCKTCMRMRVRGGAYDTNKNFKFPDIQVDASARKNPDESTHGRTSKIVVNKTEIFTPEFHNIDSIINFTTTDGIKYAITKDPNLFASINKTMFDKYKKILDGMPKDMIDLSDESSGMFFLYGVNTLGQTSYGLFYLLNRIQLMAVLLSIKKNNERFKQLEVSLPIDDTSRLPDDYNKLPHGYYYKWDDNSDNLKTFHDFINMLKRISQPDIELTDEMIDELKIPTFLVMLRMQNPKIITMKLPTASIGTTKMDEIDGGRKLRKKKHH